MAYDKFLDFMKHQALFKEVKRCMVHRLSGLQNRRASCNDENGIYIRGFPWKFVYDTSKDGNDHPVMDAATLVKYMRLRDISVIIEM